MPITYQYETVSNLIRTRARGIITTKDLLKYISDVIEDKNIGKDFVEIINMQHVSDLIIRYSELGPFPHMWEKYLEKGCRAVVCYAPTDLSYGTIRMVKSIIF